MFDFIVIGKGMIGSAAGRYLSQTNSNIALVGPDEPENWQAHNGVFASHYDQGRITRILDTDLIWGRLAQMAQDAYPEIESQSGIKFHHVVGGVRASAVSADPINTAEHVGRQLGADFEKISPSQINQQLPFFDFPEQSHILWEHSTAGYVNPRQLVAAQVKVAEQQRARIIRETALKLDKHPTHITVTTDSGTIIEGKRVLIAAGSYTNMLLPDQPLELKRESHMILRAEVGPAEQERLADMPTLIYQLPEGSAMFSLYMLPPIKYPDGKTYIKLGGNTFWEPEIFEDWERIPEWFHSDGEPKEAETLKSVLHQTLPNLKVDNYTTKPCILTYTPSNYPYLDQIDDRLFVATGGCGAAAKSSDAIGRLAALRVLGQACPESFGWEPFKAIPAG
ncbi:MAG: sarcosine oxidase [Cellvibrionaceae bacterium]|jgi:sarcosine oxidase